MVAPFAGAWIEIRVGDVVSLTFKSLPSRERGLKSPAVFSVLFGNCWSLPSRERGLKYKIVHDFFPKSFCRSLRGSVD